MVVIYMDKVRILIADSDAQFTQRVTAHLQSFPDIELIGVEATGQDALRRLRSARVDLLLFDLILPGLDGISLLRCANELRNPPATLCCTRFYSDVAMEAARNYGASYVIFKPLDLTSLHASIITCAQTHKNISELRRRSISDAADNTMLGAQIRNFIVSLGVPSKLIGCGYLAEAVRLAREDVSLTRNLSRGIYLEISRSMNTTPTRIERCIRNAISMAYQTGGLDTRLSACPSNKEFINYILRNLDF